MSAPASPPKGRGRHALLPATRKIVRRAIGNGMTQVNVAKLIGIPMPTLKLYYLEESQRPDAAGGESPRRDYLD